MDISIVVPAHNEEANILPLHRGIREALAGHALAVEIIFVDDGSTDATSARVRELRISDPLVRLIRFSRNFGQQAALLAGLKSAGGAAVITMDCDLQHPPELLPRMVEAWQGGAKVVQMVRRSTEDAGWLKRTTSSLFYRLIQALSDSPVTRNAADYQLLDRQVVAHMLPFAGRQPFLRGMVGWLGFAPQTIEYTAARRAAGAPSYNLVKMIGLAMDAITSLSSRPLRLAYYLGFFSAVVCLLYGVFALVGFAMGRSVPGWTSTVLVVVFLGSVQLFCLGIIGEYIGRIYDRTRHVPPFVVAEEEGFAGQPSLIPERLDRV